MGRKQAPIPFSDDEIEAVVLSEAQLAEVIEQSERCGHDFFGALFEKKFEVLSARQEQIKR
jgi:hypothetical protein